MNDIATIERALKDADLGIEWLAKGGPFRQKEVASLHDQITAALMLLRQIPGQHSPTTAVRQGFQAIASAWDAGATAMKRDCLRTMHDDPAGYSARSAARIQALPIPRRPT